MLEDDEKEYRNAKIEVLEMLKHYVDVKAAHIEVKTEESYKIIILKVNYSERDYEIWLEQLNFNYYLDRYNLVIDGTIWLADDSWITREFAVEDFDLFYDEFWLLNKCPVIPSTCY